MFGAESRWVDGAVRKNILHVELFARWILLEGMHVEMGVIHGGGAERKGKVLLSVNVAEHQTVVGHVGVVIVRQVQEICGPCTVHVRQWGRLIGDDRISVRNDRKGRDRRLYAVAVLRHGREERQRVRWLHTTRRHRIHIATRAEETGTGILRRGVRGRGRHGKLSEIDAVVRAGIDAQIVGSGQVAGMLRNRCKYARIGNRSGGMLHVEGRHRLREEREIRDSRHRSASGALMTSRTRVQAHAKAAVLEHIHMRVRESVWLRSGPVADGRNGSRSGNGRGVEERIMPVLERLEQSQLGQLPAQDSWIATEVVDENLGSLLVLGEVAALVEASRSGIVHEEVGGTVELDDETSGTHVRVPRLSILQRDILDVRKGKLNLVSGGIVVDVVSHARLLPERIEDHEIHRILTDAPPRSNAERATVEMVND